MKEFSKYVGLVWDRLMRAAAGDRAGSCRWPDEAGGPAVHRIPRRAPRGLVVHAFGRPGDREGARSCVDASIGSRPEAVLDQDSRDVRQGDRGSRQVNRLTPTTGTASTIPPRGGAAKMPSAKNISSEPLTRRVSSSLTAMAQLRLVRTGRKWWQPIRPGQSPMIPSSSSPTMLVSGQSTTSLSASRGSSKCSPSTGIALAGQRLDSIG